MAVTPNLHGMDLRVGDSVWLKSGGPEMTVIGQADTDVRCGFFTKDGDATWTDMLIVYLPRAALDTEKQERL